MIRNSATAAIVLCLSALGCGQPHDEAHELHRLFDEAWEFTMQEFPTFATAVGDHRFDDRLASATIDDEARRAAYWEEILTRLEAIDRSQLVLDDRINYDMFDRDLRDQLASFEIKQYLIPITSESGFHSGYPFLADLAPLRTTEDFENYIARLTAIPRSVDQHINPLVLHGRNNLLDREHEARRARHMVDQADSRLWGDTFERPRDDLVGRLDGERDLHLDRLCPCVRGHAARRALARRV